LQSVALLKNRKILIFELVVRNNLSRIIPVKITPDCKVGCVDEPLKYWVKECVTKLEEFQKLSGLKVIETCWLDFQNKTNLNVFVVIIFFFNRNEMTNFISKLCLSFEIVICWSKWNDILRVLKWT
jgi:hypothetical protein